MIVNKSAYVSMYINDENEPPCGFFSGPDTVLSSASFNELRLIKHRSHSLPKSQITFNDVDVDFITTVRHPHPSIAIHRGGLSISVECKNMLGMSKHHMTTFNAHLKYMFGIGSDEE